MHNGENHPAESVGSSTSSKIVGFRMHILDDDSSDGVCLSHSRLATRALRYPRNSSRSALFKNVNRGLRRGKNEANRIWSHDDVMLSRKPSAIPVEFAAVHPSAGTTRIRIFVRSMPKASVQAQNRCTAINELGHLKWLSPNSPLCCFGAMVVCRATSLR